MSGAQFMRCTPRHIAALWKQHAEKERRFALHLAGMQTNYLNWNRNQNERPEPYTLAEVFPHLADGKAAYTQREHTTEADVRTLQRWAINQPSAVRVKRSEYVS